MMGLDINSSNSFQFEVPVAPLPLVRHFSYPVTRLLMRTPLTPNQITALSLVFGLAAGVACLPGDYLSILIGSILFLVCYVLDNCDGEIARLKDMRSRFGMRFDTFVDWLVHAVFFVCLGLGATAATGQELWFWLGVVTSVGGCINYGIELYKNKTQPHSTELPPEESAIREDDTNMDRFVLNARTIRSDFCFIVLVLGIGGVLPYLLAPAAIGSQVYWGLQFAKAARRWHV
jgi:phosphatidylglycerophosphate synthase